MCVEILDLHFDSIKSTLEKVESHFHVVSNILKRFSVLEH